MHHETRKCLIWLSYTSSLHGLARYLKCYLKTCEQSWRQTASASATFEISVCSNIEAPKTTCMFVAFFFFFRMQGLDNGKRFEIFFVFLSSRTPILIMNPPLNHWAKSPHGELKHESIFKESLLLFAGACLCPMCAPISNTKCVFIFSTETYEAHHFCLGLHETLLRCTCLAVLVVMMDTNLLNNPKRQH